MDPLLVAVVVAPLATVAILLAVGAFRWGRRAPVDEPPPPPPPARLGADEWRATATALKLEVDGRGFTMVGSRANREIEARIATSWLGTSSEGVLVRRTEVEVRPRARLPAGLQVVPVRGADALEVVGLKDLQLGRPGLDDRLRITAEDREGALRLLCDEEVMAALGGFTGAGSGSAILADRVRLAVEGEQPGAIGDLLDLGTRLAAALEAGSDRPWARFAGFTGLAPGAWGEDGRRPWTGRVRGVAVDVRARDTAGGVVTTVQGEVAVPLPAGLRVERGAGGIRLQNPVLAPLVRAVGVDEEAVRRLLDRPEVAGPLLEVVHAWPGSALTEHAVELVAPGLLDADLYAATDAVVSLVLALRSADA